MACTCLLLRRLLAALHSLGMPSRPTQLRAASVARFARFGRVTRTRMPRTGETVNRTQRAALHASSSGARLPPPSTGDVPRWKLRCRCHCRCSCFSRSCSRLVRLYTLRSALSLTPQPSLSVGATARPPAARRQPRHPPPRRPVRCGQDCALLQAARRRRAGQRRRAADRHRAVDGRERGAAGPPPRLRTPPASGRPARPPKTESKAGRRGWTLLRGGVRGGCEGGRVRPLCTRRGRVRGPTLYRNLWG